MWCKLLGCELEIGERGCAWVGVGLNWVGVK